VPWLNNCRYALRGEFPLTHVTADAGGGWQVLLPLPSAPEIVGTRFDVQAFFVPTPWALGADVTNGIELWIGY
jgi:hypothetical protein